MSFDHPFRNRIFTVKEYVRLLHHAFSTIPVLRQVSRSRDIPRAFSERIMLAVTQVNGCRYCAYGHARMALAAGVPDQEIQQLMQGEFDSLPREEIKAILFAQHYAESCGRPEKHAWDVLVETYGRDSAMGILAYIRMIMLGNLLGNTFDAFLHRIRFNPVPGSRLYDEVGILLGSLVLIPSIGLFQSLRRVVASPDPAESIT